MCRSCRVCCKECKCSHPRGLLSPASKNRDENIFYLPLRIYFFTSSSITRIEDMNIPYLIYNSICIENISHTTLFASDPQVPDCRRRLWVDMFALLTSLRQLPVSEEHTTVCILTQRERPFFFVCKEVLQKYCKVLQKYCGRASQTLFLFLLDANRTLPEDRRVGAFPKFTDLTSCDSHKLLVLDDTASGLGDKVLH